MSVIIIYFNGNCNCNLLKPFCFLALSSPLTHNELEKQIAIEESLVTIHDIATENLGTLCISSQYRPLKVSLDTARYESIRQRVRFAGDVLQEVGIIRHGGK